MSTGRIDARRWAGWAGPNAGVRHGDTCAGCGRHSRLYGPVR